MRFAWESLQIGPRIYAVPLRDMAEIGEPLAYRWRDSPYLYPPLAILLFLPAALLSYGGWVSSSAAGSALVFVFGAAAAGATLQLWRCGIARAAAPGSIVLWAIFVASFFVQALGWSLLAQYDAVVVLVLLVGASSERPSRRLLWLGLAFALKFQALLFLPFFARELLSLVREKRSAIVRDVPVMLGTALLLLTLAPLSFLAVRGVLSPIHQTPFHLAHWANDHLTAACLALTAGIAIAALIAGEWDAAWAIVWCFAALASLQLFQGWYILYVYPLAVFVKRSAAPWTVGWALGFIYLLRAVPDFYRVVDQLLVLSP